MKIKDLFEFGGLINAELIAGKKGLDKPVESISVLEVTEPTDGRWYLNNQISISALYSIKDDIEAQKKLILEFSSSGGVGIIICHIDFWLKKVDQEVIDLCNELKFPLIIAPSNISYIDIIMPINERLLKIHSEKYKYSLDIQSKLIELIVENRDIHDIVKYIYNLSKSSSAIIDINNKAISSIGLSQETIDEIENFCRNDIKEINNKCKRSDPMHKKINNKNFCIQPVITGLDFYGFMVIEEKSSHSEKVNDLKLIIKYACIAIALINTKKQRVEKLHDMYFRDFLADLFTWNFKTEEIAIERGKAVNWDISNKKLLILVNINHIYGEKGITPCDDKIEETLKKTLIPDLEKIAKKDNHKNLVGYRSDNIVVLVEDDKNGDLLERGIKIAREFLDYYKEKPKFSLSIGISNIYEKVSDIPKSYKQSLEAMSIGRELSGDNKVFTFIELGYLPLISSGKITHSNEIRKYFLGPLLEYDGKNQTDLTETLKRLLFSDLNINEVATNMFIHRNTLLARKKRIIEILKHNPFQMPYKLNYLILLSSEDNKSSR
jgi:PucR family transcriptional regulator, purine catabolism regulatory protein